MIRNVNDPSRPELSHSLIGASRMSPPRVALVTGSGKRRVGWHLADALAGRGYALAVHYHRSAAEAEETVRNFQGRGVEAVAVQADLSDEQGARGVVRGVVGRWGRGAAGGGCA